MVEKKEPSTSNAPEGGWGWYVVFAFALNNMVVIPTIQLFGLLYKDLLASLEITNVEINTIVALNCSFGMLLAIFNGPVLRRFGFRKIAVFGVLLIFLGNLLTSQSYTFWNFILGFSVIVSIGMNLAMAAFHLALNSYFVVKRGIATGVAMSITGIGPIIMPLVVSFLISVYGARGSAIIVSAIALHSLIGACLLQPVKWHTKNGETRKDGRQKEKRKTVDDIELGANKTHESNNDAEENVSNDDEKLEVEDKETPSTKLIDYAKFADLRIVSMKKLKSASIENLEKFLPVVSETVSSTILVTDKAPKESELEPKVKPKSNDDESQSELSSCPAKGDQNDDPISVGSNSQDLKSKDEIRSTPELAIDAQSRSKSNEELISNNDRNQSKLNSSLSVVSWHGPQSLEKDRKKNGSPHPGSDDDQKSGTEDEITPSTRLMIDAESINSRSRSNEKPKSNDDENSAPLKSLDDIVRPHEDTVLERIIKFFDFDLLGDPIFVNISLGLSIAFVSEMNFAIMLPFILKERSFDTDRIAVLMSVMAGADIVSRFISPCFGESVKSQVRVVYLFSLMSGIFCRICFIYSLSYSSTLVVIFALGVTKGIRTVYTALVIPTYVPLPKLASATGLQMVNNGLLFIVFGPLMGLIREKSMDYTNWIHVINCFTACTIIMWFIEINLLHRRKKQKKPPIVIKNEQ